jgi:hypothetical protein
MRESGRVNHCSKINLSYGLLWRISIGAFVLIVQQNCESKNEDSFGLFTSTKLEGQKLEIKENVSVQALIKSAANSSVKPRASVGPARIDLAVPDENRRKPLEAVGHRLSEPSFTFIGTELDEDWILNQLLNLSPKGFKSVGATSMVFKMSLGGPIDAAFKAAERTKPRGYLAEIAAYRLARCLGFVNVPPAISRLINRKTIRDGLYTEQTTVWPKLDERLDWDDQGFVHGAAIYWVPAMRDLTIESRREMLRWTQWLDVEGNIPEENKPLAKDISDMLSFDYLIGNFDRFSGSNIKGDPKGRFLYLRDHDIAFPDKLFDTLHRRIANRMLTTKRFSKSFFHKLMELTPERLKQELDLDPISATRPVLDEKQVAGLFDRREALLSHIISLIKLHGEDRVLVFP